MRRRVWTATAVAAAVAVGPAAVADAFFGLGATPVSVSLERLEQADDATSGVDLSSDGNVVVFETLARNFFSDDDPDPPGRYRRGGIFRRNLATGRLDLVAHGALVDRATRAVLVRGASNASVSGDGRYVAFSTGEQLSPADTNDHVDVYVRDMTRPRSAAAYTLVSSPDGVARSLAYAEPEPELDFPGRNPGSELTRGTTISDDGRRVVFRTLVDSDAAGPSTPAFQVLVRDLRGAVPRTRLITRRRSDGAPPAIGGDGPAVLSADGSTVAWAGQNAPEQTPLLAGEGDDPSAYYYLWRRVDGTDPPTRRITGVADVDDPACPAGASIAQDPARTGPCYGPLAQQESVFGAVNGFPPALSADGRRVLFLTTSSPRPFVTFTGLDLFMTDMTTGRSRKRGTVELTRDTNRGGEQTSGAIDAVALSPDGRWAAVGTRRTRFALPALRAVDPERPVADRRELLLVDLDARTFERVLRTVRDTDTDADVDPSLSIARGGGRIAFTSEAANLFAGDANERSDAFVVERTPAPASPPPEPEAADQPGEGFELLPELPEERARRLTVFVKRAKGGQVKLQVRAPAAGELDVDVRGRLPGKSGKPSGPARVLADSTTRVRRRSTVTVTLKIRSDRVAALRRAGSLTGQASLLFIARGGVEYERRVAVTFRPSPKARKKPAKRTRKSAAKGRG